MPKDIDLKTSFHGGGDQPKRTEEKTVPERIRRHAPAPVLRPGGSWKARADEVDRRVREQHEAQRARNEWAARAEARQGRTLCSKFKRSMK